MSIVDTYSKIIANLFYFFLIATIFNPYFDGYTLYLYIIIPFLDILFIKWIFKSLTKIKINLTKILAILILVILLLKKIIFFIKAIAIVITVLYIIYTYLKGKFYLYNYFFVSFLLALVQFILIFIDYKLAFLIGPTSLSHLVLGNYAGPTFTNFYPFFSEIPIPRVSGLSREGGFFASLVVATILIYIVDPNKRNKSILRKFSLFLAFFISLSKSSFGIISVFFTKLRLCKICYIPFSVTSAFILLILILQYIISPIIINIALNNNLPTYLHRFGGYYLLNFLDLKEFLFGITNMEYYKSLDFVQEVWKFVKHGNWTGWALILINYGFIYTILIILCLELLGLTLVDFILITILTFNTSPLTLSNQVVLTYFLIFLLHYRRKVKNEFYNKCQIFNSKYDRNSKICIRNF